MAVAFERAASRSKNDAGYPQQVVDVRLPVKGMCSIPVWFIGDTHVDSVDCDAKRLQADIKKIAADPAARVVIGGDWNDMIFHGDPRYTASGLAKRLRGEDNYSRALLDYNIELLEPIKDKIDLFISGNHEEEFCKRHGFNAAAFTADALGVPYFSYGAVLRYWLSYKSPGNKADNSKLHGANSSMVSGLVYHGCGGDAPVTKGMITFYRLNQWQRCDFLAIGHQHQKTYSDDVAMGSTGSFGNGRIQASPRASVMWGSYKLNWMNKPSAGWSMQKGHAPAPIGAGRMYLNFKIVDGAAQAWPSVQPEF